MAGQEGQAGSTSVALAAARARVAALEFEVVALNIEKKRVNGEMETTHCALRSYEDNIRAMVKAQHAITTSLEDGSEDVPCGDRSRHSRRSGKRRTPKKR